MVQAYSVGAYRMAYTIGVGTFGRVKLATHEVTGQKVAIKIINRARMQSLEMHEKILREISILQRLGAHPHVIRLYELLDTPTDIFMVMEYVPGGELFDYIVQRSRLPEMEARRFFQQIISGVEYCHRHMICHRDLKPENVLLENDRSVKVGDFGLSNFMKDGDYLKTSCGSPNYAAPEVVSGKAYAGPEVDAWSCGVILYALLCGSLPFDDEHVPNLFKKIKHGSFSLPGHLSENARRLIVRMLMVDPSARITLKEIRRHPWTREQLPLPSCLWQPEPDYVDHEVLTDLERLGYTITPNEVVKYQKTKASVFLPREIVAYNLLLDKKRAERIRDGTSAPVGFGRSDTPLAFSKEARSRQLTAAVFQSDYTPFGFMTSNGGDMLTGVTTSTRQTSGDGLGSSAFSRQLSRSSVVSNSTATDPPKYKLGIESTMEAATIMTAIFHTLRSIGFEWQILSQHKIICRARNQKLETADSKLTDGVSDGVILCIQVFRLYAGRSAVNVQVFDGSLVAGMRSALSTLFAIYRTLAQAQQQSGGGASRTRKATS